MKCCRSFHILAALLGLALILTPFSSAYAAGQEVSMAIDGKGENNLPVFQDDDHDPQGEEHNSGMENHTGGESDGHEQPEEEARHEPDHNTEVDTRNGTENANHPEAGEHSESEVGATAGPSWGVLGGFLGINLIILAVAAVMRPKPTLTKS
jgi:hypothetical protein